LYQAFGWTPPTFAHLPLLLKPEGNGKLSKRDADLGGFPVFPLEWKDPATGQISKGFREEGYLPEATLNFLAFLGWNPGTEQELFSLSELVDAFSLERINKAGAKFDVNKAKWFNEQYLKNQPVADLVSTFLPEMESTKAQAFASLYLDRITFPNELVSLSKEFFELPAAYDEQVVTSKWNEENQRALTLLNEQLGGKVASWEADAIKHGIQEVLEAAGIKMGKVMQLLRVALSGKGAGPDLMISMELWGRESVFERLTTALQKIPAQHG
jgi:glutamyl-tRNA synthetase